MSPTSSPRTDGPGVVRPHTHRPRQRSAPHVVRTVPADGARLRPGRADLAGLGEQVALLGGRQARRDACRPSPRGPLVGQHVDEGRSSGRRSSPRPTARASDLLPKPAYSGSGSHSGSDRGPAQGCTSWPVSHAAVTGTARPVKPADPRAGVDHVRQGQAPRRRRSPGHSPADRAQASRNVARSRTSTTWLARAGSSGTRTDAVAGEGEPRHPVAEPVARIAGSADETDAGQQGAIPHGRASRAPRSPPWPAPYSSLVAAPASIGSTSSALLVRARSAGVRVDGTRGHVRPVRGIARPAPRRRRGRRSGCQDTSITASHATATYAVVGTGPDSVGDDEGHAVGAPDPTPRAPGR